MERLGASMRMLGASMPSLGLSAQRLLAISTWTSAFDSLRRNKSELSVRRLAISRAVLLRIQAFCRGFLARKRVL